MLNTPRDSKGGHQWVMYGVLAAFWLGEALALFSAAYLAGADPAPSFSNSMAWFINAVTSFAADRQMVLWHWVDPASTIQSSLVFYVVFAFFHLVYVGLGVVVYGTLRGGFPAFFPAFLRNNTSVMRSSHLGLAHEVRELVVSKPEERRIILGHQGRKLIATEAGASLLVFGPTQSGKSSALCIPAILEWDGPVVAVSVKNDLVYKTGGYRQRKGKVQVYDPSGELEIPSVTWSPTVGCENFDQAMKMVGWMTDGMDKDGGGSSDWGHWKDAALALLSAAFYAAACTNEGMSTVNEWILDTSGMKLRTALMRISDPDPRAFINFESIAGKLITRPGGGTMIEGGRQEKERQTCFGVCARFLRLFQEKNVARSSETSEFDPHKFLSDDSNPTLYLVAPIQAQARLAPLFTGIVMSVMTEAAKIAQISPSGRLPKGLLVVLDEAANTAPISELPEYLSTGFAQGITLITIFQDGSQLKSRYKERADSVKNNSRATMFLPGIKDPETLRYMSELVGKESVTKRSHSKEGGWSESEQEQEILPAHAARQIRKGIALLVYHTYSPMMLAQRAYYLDPLLSARSDVKYQKGISYVPPRNAIEAGGRLPGMLASLRTSMDERADRKTA
jgi:type IV secretion system protein VirD4